MLCREAVSKEQQLPFAAHGGESKREGGRGWAELCPCLRGLGLLQHIWGNAGMWLHLLSSGRTQTWEQVGMVGDPLWLWMHFSHHLLFPRQVLGNLDISIFQGRSLYILINILYFLVVVLGGRGGGTTKLLGWSFSINTLNPFHCFVFYLGLHNECLCSQSSWLSWTSSCLILLIWLFSHTWFCWKSSIGLIRAFSTVTLQLL